jgi:hypothetical protein
MADGSLVLHRVTALVAAVALRLKMPSLVG